jgi:hypothetical protein
LGQALGPHDPQYAMPRTDAYPGDGLGSPYAMLVALLPGFGLFRYPSKLLTLTAAAAAVLAGAGWDEVASGRSGRVARASAAGLAASLVGLALALAFGPAVVRALSGRLMSDALTGPPDAAGTWALTQRALAWGVPVYAAGLGLAVWGPRRPDRVGALALLVLGVDLGLASSRLVYTAPQATFDSTPELARRIEAAERADPSPGPFRVHRMPLWHPERFEKNRSPDRTRELTAWEHETLQNLHGLPFGVEGSVSAGVLELDELLVFFRPQTLPAGVELARALRLAPGDPVFYYPRRSYDLWGARYFIIPVRSYGWGTERRGYASFVPGTDIIYPDPATFEGEAGRERWADREDWQLVRNRAAYPRAWIVHSGRVVPPATDFSARAELTDEIVYQNDAFWSEPGRPVFDAKQYTWIESYDRRIIRGALASGPVEPGESVTVTRSEPQRVELRARLNRPGLVILADTFYPGWHLTIDGQPATILRANRLMRGAAVGAGVHTLVYVYDPLSFRVGLAVSILGLLGLLALLAWRRRPEPDPGNLATPP